MNKNKIIITIVSAMLVAGLGTAVTFAPESIDKILLAISALITAVSSALNGANNSV